MYLSIFIVNIKGNANVLHEHKFMIVYVYTTYLMFDCIYYKVLKLYSNRLNIFKEAISSFNDRLIEAYHE